MTHLRLLPTLIAAHLTLCCTAVLANGILDLVRNGPAHPLLTLPAKPPATFPKCSAKLVSFMHSPSGRIIEKYSDGLTVQTEADGERYAFKIPTKFSAWSAASSAPSAGVSEIYGTEGAYLQSSLRHCAQYYLEHNQPQKAEVYAQKYLKVQQDLNAHGLPLALAESMIGQTQLQLNHSSEAIASLESASEFFKNDKHSLTYATILYELGNAYLKSNDLIAAKRQFELCRRIAVNNSYSDLLEKINDTLK